MNYKKFTDLNISTITSICEFNKKINYKNFFLLLPIYDNKIQNNIISMTCEGLYKGFNNNSENKKRNFKHCIELYFKTKNKQVNIKINKKGLHLTGAKSKKDIEYSFNKLINLINKYNKKILFMKDNFLKKKEVANWFLKNLKGNIKKRKENNLIYQDDKIKYYEIKIIKDYEIIIPKILKENKIPLGLNKEIFNLIKNSIQDEILSYKNNYFSCIKNKIKCIINFKNIFKGEKPLKIINDKIVMCNYNYNVGFKIYRNRLNEIFNNIKIKDVYIENFFNNDLNPVATIRFYINKDGVEKKHSFLVYKTGSITQSGPGDEDMEYFYNIFMNILHENKDYVEWVSG